ncbi:MAG: hypothetical protein MK207_08495 [Saprospiraceae bacterium]|nr:hypothetical protein [Saprospiraceae bacterium]
MTSKNFLRNTIFLTTFSLVLIGLFNFKLDIYGIFGNRNTKSIRVFHNEHKSKTLMMYKYVPQNFSSILLGPSLSANINTKEYPEEKIYNGSVMAHNISDMAFFANIALDKGDKIKNVIICLDPYIIKDHGMKNSSSPNALSYFSALGSMDLFKAYLVEFIRENEFYPSKYPKNNYNNFGYNNFNLRKKWQTKASEIIPEKIKKHDIRQISFDSIAINELSDLVNSLRERKINIYAYHTPIPETVFEFQKEKYQEFRKITNSIFSENELILDFNQIRYKDFVLNYDNFIDHGHLSERGQKFVFREILLAIKKVKHSSSI